MIGEFVQLVENVKSSQSDVQQLNESIQSITYYYEHEGFLEMFEEIISNEEQFDGRVKIYLLSVFKIFIQEEGDKMESDFFIHFMQLVLAYSLKKPQGTQESFFSICCLLDMSIISCEEELQMPRFLIENMPEALYPYVTSNYYAEFESSFVKTIFVYEARQAKREPVDSFAIELMQNSQLDEFWLNICTGVTANLPSFQGFDWVIDRFQAAFGHEKLIDMVINYITLVSSYPNDDDADFYYKLYEFSILLSQHLREKKEDNMKEQDQLMLLWIGVLFSEPNFCSYEAFEEPLIAILEELGEVFLFVEPENELWCSLISNLGRFTQMFTENINPDVLGQLFILVNHLISINIQATDEIENVIGELWCALTDPIAEAIENMITEEDLNVVGIVAHLWAKLSRKDNHGAMSDSPDYDAYMTSFGPRCCDLLVSASEPPESSLLFITKVGINYPEYHPRFFEIIAQNFFNDNNRESQCAVYLLVAANATNTELQGGEDVLQWIASEIPDPFSNFWGEMSASLILLMGLYEVTDIAGDLVQVLLQGAENSFNNADELRNAIQMLSEICEYCVPIKKSQWATEFATTAYDAFRELLSPSVLLMQGAPTVHHYLVKCVLALNRLGLIQSLAERSAEWLDGVIQAGVFEPDHLDLIAVSAPAGPVQSLLEFIESLEPRPIGSDEADPGGVGIVNKFASKLLQLLAEKDRATASAVWAVTPADVVLRSMVCEVPDVETYAHQAVSERLSAPDAAQTTSAELARSFAEAAVFDLKRRVRVGVRDDVCKILAAAGKLTGPDAVAEVLAAQLPLQSAATQELIGAAVAGDAKRFSDVLKVVAEQAGWNGEMGL